MAQQRDQVAPKRTARNPILATAFVLYGTLLLLMVTIPESMVSWLQGLNANVVQQTALRAAQAVQAASDRTGLSAPFLRARAVFLEQVRGE